MDILQSVFSNNTNGLSIGSVLKDNFGISLKITYTSTPYSKPISWHPYGCPFLFAQKHAVPRKYFKKGLQVAQKYVIIG